MARPVRALLRLLTGLALVLAAGYAAAAPAERRVALVIGNASYLRFPSLPNPRNDAEDVMAALQRSGFEVIGGVDLTREAMRDLLRRFARAAQGADAALAYYAGHGLQYKGRNYLLPVDARLQDEFDLEYETVRVDDVVGELNRAEGARIIILDACRNLPLKEQSRRNPFVDTGLARINGRGLVVAYATQADALAYDGVGRNSIFTEAFLKAMGEPGLDLPQFFQRVSSAVDRSSGGRQTPELSSSYPGQFYFNLGETAGEAWRRVRDSADPEAVRDFVRTFPGSDLAETAKARLALLEARPERRPAEAQADEPRRRRLAEEQAEEARRKRLADERAAEEARQARLAADAEAARRKLLAEAAETQERQRAEEQAEGARQARP
ncbi:caspase family protein, partial [Methylobacterium crusticola]